MPHPLLGEEDLVNLVEGFRPLETVLPRIHSITWS